MATTTAEIPFTSMFPGLIGPDPPCAYTFERQLKSGTTCEMRVIKRKEDGREFAAKLVRLGRMTERQRLRARAEVTCLANCDHFGVIKFEAAYRAGEDLLIITELCDAGDLEFQINLKAAQGEKWDEKVLKIILLQLCMSIHHIHGKNMLHRDIKSANVMITTAGLFKLGDFGFSKQMGPDVNISAEIAETLVGTPYYLAPELWKRQRYGSKADIWSLGVLMYRLMAEHYPFGTENVGMDQLRDAVVSGHCAPLPSRFSQQLRDIVSSCLTPNPAIRPAAIDLLRTPYLSEMITGGTFFSMVSNTQLPDPVKASALKNIADLKALITGAPVVRPTAALVAAGTAAPLHEGVVARYKEGRFDNRYLVLRPTTLEVFLTKETFDREKVMKEPFSLDKVESVAPVSSEATNDKHDSGRLFALNLTDASCLLFRAETPEERQGWLDKLQAALLQDAH